MKKKLSKDSMIIIGMLYLLIPLFALGLLLKLVSDEASGWYAFGYIVAIGMIVLVQKQADRYNKKNREYKRIYPIDIENINSFIEHINTANMSLMETKGTPHYLHDEIGFNLSCIKDTLDELEETK